MTPEHIAAVRRSFTRISGRHAQVADMFRVNLMRIDPALITLYQGHDEGQHLMQTFSAVVALLNKPEFLHPSLRRLGRRIGIARAAQVCSVGRALMDTLRQALGTRWDDTTEGAWTAVYAEISTTVISAMIEVAVEQEQAANPRAAAAHAEAIAA